MMRVFFPAPDGPYTSKCGKSPHWTWNKQLLALVATRDNVFEAKCYFVKLADKHQAPTVYAINYVRVFAFENTHYCVKGNLSDTGG